MGGPGRLWDLRPPPEIVGSVALYGFTLLAMISCSAVYNSGLSLEEYLGITSVYS